jgi:hypothetical protein
MTAATVIPAIATNVPTIVEPSPRSTIASDKYHFRNENRVPWLPHNWERISLDAIWQALNSARPTPQTTVEAVLHCVRERGLKALKEPANIERLSRCDAAAKAEIERRTAKLIARKDISK